VFHLQLKKTVCAPDDLLKSVVEALSEIAPAEHYLQTNVTVPSGHVIGKHFFLRKFTKLLKPQIVIYCLTYSDHFRYFYS